MTKPIGNVLGSSRAENDSFMLDRAFVETSDYGSLVKTRDFNFVVGRRGTGKSALFRKVADHFDQDKSYLLVRAAAQEDQALLFQNMLSRFGSDYQSLRRVSRIAWKIHLLIEVAKKLQAYYKTRSSDVFAYLSNYLLRHASLAQRPGMLRCAGIVESCLPSDTRGVTGAIAQYFDIENLRVAVQVALEHAGLSAVFLYDGLDEGWSPDVLPTAVIGGLAKAAAELVESDPALYPVIFVRDNVFRALGELDTDFTRHIEGSAIRLHWEEASLLHLVAQRLRVAFAVDHENDIKVWNRFGQKQLAGREGFRRALRNTLYRPRDILTLLNSAYQLASREGRSSLIEQDIESSANGISRARMDDLVKEYDRVLPGLRHFVKVFSGGPAVRRVDEMIEMLDEAISSASCDQPGTSDFALFNDAREIFFALYSVGFIGVGSSEVGAFTFCHDGSTVSAGDVGSQPFATIHPCYWHALAVVFPEDPSVVVVHINDEHDTVVAPEPAQARTRLLGTITEDLPRTPRGMEGSVAFEKWVLRVVKVLFDGKLANAEAKPNPGALQQRDIVATNVAERGFWKRIHADYGVRQVVFECKNYDELTADDYRQVLSYSGGEYGKFAIVVTRNDKEYLSELDQQWIRELNHKHDGRIVMPLPAELLSRSIKKLRNMARSGDYAEDVLGKRMDMIVRRVLNVPHSRRYRPKKKH
jgi:hypothetical protein